MKYAVVFFAVLLSVMRSAAQWSGATVDTLTRNAVSDQLTKQSLAVDEAGTLHIVWQTEVSGGAWRIAYAKRPVGGQWSQPSEVTPAGFAMDPVLALRQTTGAPYIAFVGATALSNEVMLARDSAGAWAMTRITADTLSDFSPTIAVDRNGRIHIAWISELRAGLFKIKYAHNVGGSWQVQTLTDSELGPFGSGAAPFIAVTDSGRAHITYRGGNFTGYHIHHAWNAAAGSGSWQYETVQTPNGEDFISATYVTPDNTLHLLASGNDGFGFPPHAYYLKKTGTAWSQAVLANPGHNGWGGSLFIDRAGSAHITSNETSGNLYTGNLYYATNRTGTWASTPLLADGATFDGLMVVGAQGKGHAVANRGSTSSSLEIVAIHSAGTVTSVKRDGAFIPSTFSLEQNYPNPFNPSTNFKYQIPNADHVTLKVFDMLGREVATLVDEWQEAGVYHVTWNARLHLSGFSGQAAELASGVYYYQLRSGELVQTKQMMLIR